VIFKEKYNKMIEIIESNISEGNEYIENELSRHFGENLRLIADAFKFITGNTLSKYIRERKLINVIKEKKAFDISFEEAIERFGITDAASFSKSAKTMFGKAPTLMTDAEIEARVPLTLDVILRDEISGYSLCDAEPIQTESRATSFGVTADQYSEISKTLTIAAVYGLNDECAELAHSIAKGIQIPIENACDFVADYVLQIENGSCIQSYSLDELALLSYKYDLSYSEAQSVMFELEIAGIISITELPAMFFDIYFSEENSRTGLCVEEICDIAEAMESHGLAIGKLFDVIDRGMWKYGGDILEAIENFDEDEAEWEKFISDGMAAIEEFEI